MSGRGRKRGGNGGTNSPRGMQQVHQVRQGSSFWTCPACRTDVHIALMSFHISSDCPVVGDDVLPTKAKTQSQPLLDQEGTTERRGPFGTDQSPAVSSEFSVASTAMGKQDIRQKLAWEEEEEEEDVTPEEEKLHNRASFSSGAEARGETVSCLQPETPIPEGRDKSAVNRAMSASPSAEGVKRSPAEATRKRLFEDWEEKLNREPEFVMQRSPCDDPDDAAAAPSSTVDGPQAKRPRVMEPGVDNESRMVVELDSIDLGSEGDDVAHVGMRSSIRDSQKEEVAKQQVPNHARKIPKSENEKELEFQQEKDHDKWLLEAAVEIQNGEILGAVVSEREEQLEIVIRELRDQCSRALLREIESQRALNVKNGECERLRRSEQGMKEELLSARGRAFELETTSQCLREECETLRSREQGLQEELVSVRERIFELETTSQELREECETLRRREHGLHDELFSVRGRAVELATTLQKSRERVKKGEQKTRANRINHELDQSQPTQIYKEEESLATQLLSQTSNSLASCGGTPKAVQDEFDVTKVSSENTVEMDNEVQATQLVSDGLVPQCSPCIPVGEIVKDEFDVTKVSSENTLETDNEVQATQLLSDDLAARCSPCIPVAGKNFQASADSRRVCGAGITDPPDEEHEEFSLSPKTKPKSVDKSPVLRLFDDGGTQMTKASPKDNSDSPRQSSITTPASALSPQTLGKALKPAADEHENIEGFEDLHTVGNQRTEGMLGGGPKTPEKFAVMLGFQEKGLISEMLDSFPPAQGKETPYGIDPFDDHFLDSLNKTVSNVASISKVPTEHPLQDVRTFVSVSGADEKFGYDNGSPAMLHGTEASQEDTSAEMGPKKKRLTSPVLVSDSDDNEMPAMPRPSEVSQEETLAETVSKKKKRKNACVLIDSDSDMDAGDEGVVHDVRRSISSTGDATKKRQESTVPGTKFGKFGTHMREQTSNPTVESFPGPAMEASRRDRSFDEKRPSSPTVDVLFGFRVEEQCPSSRKINFSLGMEGDEEEKEKLATAVQGGGSRERSCSVDRPDVIIESLRRDRNLYRKAFSPRPVNVILSSSDEDDYIWEGSRGSSVKKRKRLIDEEDHICEGSPGSGDKKGKRLFNEEDHICEGSRGSGGKKGKPPIDEEDHTTEGSRGSSGGKKGKRRRLVKLKESSPDGVDSLQPEPILDGTKETCTQEVRRSGRLRNVYAKGPKETTLLSDQEKESDSIEDMQCQDLGTNGDGSSSKPIFLDDDDQEDKIEIDSNSSDGSPIGARPKHRNDKATQPSRNSAVRRNLFGINQDADVDMEDDIDSDDSFINDDPELDDGKANTSSSVDEISDSGKESENEGSSGSRSSSDKRKEREKYNWELEGDMLAALGKDIDLCLRGLCALYRRQEDDEKMWANSTHKNSVGFSKFHAARASNYASFLMGGVLSGPVVKTAEELESEFRFDDSVVTYCSDMCIHYSKQLFDIYQNDEDPYFPEPYTDPLP